MLLGRPTEIQRHSRLVPINAYRKHKTGTVIESQLTLTLGKAKNQLTNTAGPMALKQNHLMLHDCFAVQLNKTLETINPRLIRSDLSLQIGVQLRFVAGWRHQAIRDGFQLIRPDEAVPHKQERAQTQSLVVDGATEGGHRTRRKPSNIGMVPAAGHEKIRPGVIEEDRSDGSDIGQMRSAMEWVIAEPCVTGLETIQRADLKLGQQITNTIPHRAEMDGDVGCVGHKAPISVKQRTREIQPFADVHRSAALLQTLTHLLSDGHETMPEQLRFQRIVNVDSLRDGIL